jgi:hypothetical protein
MSLTISRDPRIFARSNRELLVALVIWETGLWCRLDSTGMARVRMHVGVGEQHTLVIDDPRSR